MFVDDTYFDETIETIQGPVRVFAETRILGTRLLLDELLVYPRSQSEPLRVGVGQVLSIRRSLNELAKAEGFTELTLSFHRVGPRRTGRTISFTRRLP